MSWEMESSMKQSSDLKYYLFFLFSEGFLEQHEMLSQRNQTNTKPLALRLSVSNLQDQDTVMNGLSEGT